MNHRKASVDFTRRHAAEMPEVAGRILERMSANAATFPAPPVSMAALGAQVEDYKAKFAARASRAAADVLALKAARADLNRTLGLLGGYVNHVAQGDPAIVEQSGFPSYATARTPDRSPPAAPENLRLEHGALTGTVLARFRAQRRPPTNEVQICTGNPNDETAWRTVGMFVGQKALLTGLTPGTFLWVRVRTAGLRGVMGAWSDPAEIMVL
jgi:hypothetical protein